MREACTTRARRTMRSLARGGLAGLAAAAALSVIARPAASQSGARAITLKEALDIASGANPAVRRAENDVLLNGTEMRTTWLSQLLPTASLSLSTAYTGNLQRNAVDNFGNPIANPSADWVYFSNTYQILNLSWRVQGPSLLHEYRRQQLVNRGREVGRNRALAGVESQVRQLYMDALEQRELMESEAELLEARRVDQQVAERLFSLALRTRVDVLNAELQVEQQTLALRRQEAAYRTALLELRTALGVDDEGAIEPTTEPLPLFDPTGLDADGLVRRALNENPSLRERDLAVQTSARRLAIERNDWWPDIQMGIDLFRRAQTTSTGALFDPAFDQDLESQFFVRFSLPVFNDYFGRRQSREQATIALRNERETDREARLEVEGTVRSAVLALETQWESLRYLERSAEIAGEALRLAREEYRLGTRTFEDYRPAIDQEAEARRQVITARHAFVEALLRLEEAVGGPVRPAGAAPPPGSGGR